MWFRKVIDFCQACLFLIRYWIWSQRQDFSLTWDKEGTGHYSGQRTTAYFLAMQNESDKSGKILYSIKLLSVSVKNSERVEGMCEMRPDKLRTKIFSDIREFYLLAGDDAVLIE